MAKGKNATIFFCQECGHESAKWLGQCPGCKSWNTMVEEKVNITSKGMGGAVKAASGSALRSAEPAKLSEVSMSSEERISTRMEELNRVLGGGIVPGSLTLVGGDRIGNPFCYRSVRSWRMQL